MRTQFTDRGIKALGRGKHRIAPGLYLHLAEGRSATWAFRYVAPNGKRREMSIGTYPGLSLADATRRASEHRQAVKDGVDPIEQRAAAREAGRRHAAGRRSLLQAAMELHTLMQPTWRNTKHSAQWMSSLNHLGPLLERPLDSITAGELLAALEELNRDKHETAKRVRQRVEAIYDKAIVQGAVKENPARSIVRHLKPPAQRGRGGHHAALPPNEVPKFILDLRDSDAAQSVRLAFEFLILTATRTGEVIGATWEEIDESKTVWTIPAARMKAGAPHQVPLTDRMRAILAAMEGQRGTGWNWIFPSPAGRAKPLSDGAFRAVLRRMDLSRRATTHGFRSAFSSWAYESTDFRSEIIEAALAHTEKNAVKSAYNRAEYWSQRVELAARWTAYSTSIE